MSKTLLNRISYYLNDEELEKIHSYRGALPASRVAAIAVRRLLNDLDKGKVDLLKENGAVGKK